MFQLSRTAEDDEDGDEDGDIAHERGYVGIAVFLDRDIVTTARVGKTYIVSRRIKP